MIQSFDIPNTNIECFHDGGQNMVIFKSIDELKVAKNSGWKTPNYCYNSMWIANPVRYRWIEVNFVKLGDC